MSEDVILIIFSILINLKFKTKVMLYIYWFFEIFYSLFVVWVRLNVILTTEIVMSNLSWVTSVEYTFRIQRQNKMGKQNKYTNK